MDECLESCLECYKNCCTSLKHCLFTNKISYVKFLRECIEATELLSVFLRTRLASVYEVTHLCAKICDSCVEFINAQDDADEILQLCADECFQCSVSCRSLIL